jgi:hypothetical protein
MCFLIIIIIIIIIISSSSSSSSSSRTYSEGFHNSPKQYLDQYRSIVSPHRFKRLRD